MDKYKVDHLKGGFVAGSGVAEELMRQLFNEFPSMKYFTQGYGQTECSPVITISDGKDPFEKKSQTVGRAFAHTELKIINTENG